MNLKLILIVTLMVLVFTSIILFGFLAYGTKSDTDASTYFDKYAWVYYTNLGIEVTALLIAALLFIKR